MRRGIDEPRGGGAVIEQLRAHATAYLPLRVVTAEWSNDALVLTGDGWSATVNCPWRVSRLGVMVFSWDSKDAADLVWDLIGHDVVDVVAQSSVSPADPAVVFSGGLALEVFSDTAIDPWVMGFPGMTFVGSPTDPALRCSGGES
jgi:hypothetical protein